MLTEWLVVIGAHEAAWRDNEDAISAAQGPIDEALVEMIELEERWRSCCRQSGRRRPECGCGQCPGLYAAAAARRDQAKAALTQAIATKKAGVTPAQWRARIEAMT